MVPSTWREGRWVIRSSLWVNKDIEAEQVAIESPDLTAAVIRPPERLIFMASVYVVGGDAPALYDRCDHLRKAVAKVRRGTGAVVEVMVLGDLTAMINAGEETRCPWEDRAKRIQSLTS